MTGEVLDQRAPRDLPRTELDNRARHRQPPGGRQKARQRSKGRQGITLKMRSSGPGVPVDGVNRTSSRLCSKMRMYSAYSRGYFSGDRK